MKAQHVCISHADVSDCFCALTFHYDLGFAQTLTQLLKLGRTVLWTRGKQRGGRRRKYLLSRAIIYHFQTGRQDKE